MMVKVSFALGTRSVLTIPKKAIVFRSEVIGVYVLSKDGKINLRRIRPGRTLADDNIVVLAGLAEGEQIALDPVMAVKSLKLQAQ
jgi:hypothetical protein